MATPEEVAWAAGLFEGEGTITRSGSALYVRMGNTDEEVVQRLADVLAVGSVYGPYPPYGSAGHRKKPLWVWLAREEAGLDALALMWPWLSERRRRRARELTGVPFHVFYRVSSELLPGASAQAPERPDAA